MADHTLIETQGNARFSPQVEQVLREAGWFPGRVVPESQMEQWYAFKLDWECGYDVGCCYAHSWAIRALREFGGLCFKEASSMEPEPWYREAFCIDPTQAMGIGDINWLFNEWHVGDTLFPLGPFGEDGIMVLAISRQGRVFRFGYGSAMVAGNTVDEAIENLLSGKKSTELLIPDYEEKMVEAGSVRTAIYKLYAG